MAKDDERPQFNPKHRIAGAIILVSLAVIFVPMLLDESTPPSENEALTQIPQRDAPAETKVAVTELTPTPELGTAPTAVAESVTTPAEQPSAPARVPTPVADVAEVTKPPSKVASVEKIEDSAATAKPVSAKPSDVAEKISKGWVVQVGTFANKGNADRLTSRLKSLGYAVDTESVTVQGSKATRLRVGPYRDKTDATNARAKLQKDLNIQGLVLAYP